ncbi:hypothetical protein [Desulfitobacterium sp. AusDCA]|uniref:hypothetical protein n=1 Tax=Desulfitobacterium sp. AusDCA TaxID=3240383 RepID=UPI003DA6DC06
MEKDSAGHFWLKVLFNGREKAAFPVKATGVNPTTGEITLDGKDYTVISITLNNDQTSGWVTLQSLSVLPSSIQTVSISDDSPAGVFGSPKSQQAVLDRVSAWLKTAKPYTSAVPSFESVDNIVHHNIGPSALHITMRR